MTNVRAIPTGVESSLCANGQPLSPIAKGDLSGVWCDNTGKQLFEVKVKDVRISPDSPYNMISTTKRQKEGFIMTGTDKYIKLAKGDHEFVFNIVINTPEGLVFAAYIKRNAESCNEVAAPGIDGHVIPSTKNVPSSNPPK